MAPLPGSGSVSGGETGVALLPGTGSASGEKEDVLLEQVRALYRYEWPRCLV